MKKAFSTLGCPGWTFDEILSVAKDIGMDGIEIRGLGEQMYAPKIGLFLEENIKSTLQNLNKFDLSIPILTSSCDLSNEDFEGCLREASEYSQLAQKLNSKYIRIMCESTPAPRKNIDLEVIAERYSKICDISKSFNVTALIETNGILANSKNMKKFLQLSSNKNAKVLWDIHHPFRFFKESPEYTFDQIGEFIEYIHVKDSIMKDGKVIYKMMGWGDVPVELSIKVLQKHNYQGFISLEWVKRWCTDLQESGIVFPQYANYIDDVLNLFEHN